MSIPAGQSERACLCIADISGYTDYLTGVELDHAQDILVDLLTTVVEPLRPAFHVAKLEGDAIFLYAPVDSIDGSGLLDRVEGSYYSFQRRLLAIRQATTCECNACIRIPELDLKLVVHHGSMIRHEVLGHEEVVGPDVIVVHRLLKNRIVKDFNIPAYALLTDTCIAATALDPELLGMTRYEDEYEGVGSVGGWVHDLRRAWAIEHQRNRVYVAPQDAVWSMETLIPDVPPALVWEWITTPALRMQWEVGLDVSEVPTEGGRRGVGTQTHCAHGEAVILNEMLDWRPPNYMTNKGWFPGEVGYIVTDEIVPQDGGVLVRKSMRSPSVETRPALEEVLASLGPMMETWSPVLAERLTEAYASIPAITEPDLPLPDESARLSTTVSST
jgi:uncharacterized protein YndB with AHSA1/START domain